jgi:hypothetical protein
MMNSTSHLHEPESQRAVQFLSIEWYQSRSLPGVKYAIRRITLAQRIELARRARELAGQNEYLRTGDAVDQLEATMGDLLVEKLYLDWGLAEVTGLSIDGTAVSAADVIQRGPERLTHEIAQTLRSYLVLTDEERKNF